MSRRGVISIFSMLVMSGCVSHVNPDIAPEQLPRLTPSFHSRVLLMIVPSFVRYTTEASSDMHETYYHLGESTAAALIDVLRRSFESVDVRQASEAQGYQVLAAPSDTSVTDLVIVPHFDGGGFKTSA